MSIQLASHLAYNTLLAILLLHALLGFLIRLFDPAYFNHTSLHFRPGTLNSELLREAKPEESTN
jgi:hypothetical protein